MSCCCCYCRYIKKRGSERRCSKSYRISCVGLHAIWGGGLLQKFVSSVCIFSNAVFVAECKRNGHCSHFIQYLSLSKHKWFGVKGAVAVSSSRWCSWLVTKRQHHSMLLVCPAVSAGPCGFTSLSTVSPVKWKQLKSVGERTHIGVACFILQSVHLEIISLSFTPTSPLTKVSNILLTSFLMIVYTGKSLCRIILSLSEYRSLSQWNCYDYEEKSNFIHLGLREVSLKSARL